MQKTSALMSVENEPKQNCNKIRVFEAPQCLALCKNIPLAKEEKRKTSLKISESCIKKIMIIIIRKIDHLLTSNTNAFSVLEWKHLHTQDQLAAQPF